MVWEESIILAPKAARFAFLSATIPNAREFAQVRSCELGGWYGAESAAQAAKSPVCPAHALVQLHPHCTSFSTYLVCSG